MTITDDSTGLTSSYTEKPVVAFNANTLGTIDDCVIEVEIKLKRGALTSDTNPSVAQVKQWLIRAKQELAEVKGFTFKRRYATVSTVASQIVYSLPPDYAGGHTVLRDTTSDRAIKIFDRHWLDTKYPDPSAESTGEPKIAAIKNLELWLVPPPDGVYTLELEYERSGADNTVTDFSWLPELHRFYCCDFAIAECFESLHMWQQANIYRGKWNSGMGRSIKADGRKRWQTTGYRILSYMEEAVMRSYQSTRG